jgi:putative salt-induced outer membrane protein YdiY
MRLTQLTAPVLCLSMAVILPLHAEDAPPKKPWSNVGEASVLSTNGNSKSTSTSFKNLFKYDWTKAGLELDGGAMGSSNANAVTSENYYASEKTTWKLTVRNYVYERFKWDKDRFSGIRNRYDSSAGLGRLLLDFSNDKLNGELGGGYINEERTESPRNDYASGRAYGKYVHTFNPATSFSQDAEYLHNFKTSKGYRINTETAVIAALTTHLSLKTSYVWKHNNLPPPGIGKDDTTTSVALIINY